jgi:chromosome segregation ATPase
MLLHPKESASQKPPVGVMGKLTRWWRGPSPVSVRVPSNPPGAAGGGRASLSATAAAPSEPIRSEQISQVSGGESSSAVNQIHAVLMLERVLPELEETKRVLRSEREAAKAKVLDLERECDRLRAEAERARNERTEVESHSKVLRKSVSALERQLEEGRIAAAYAAEEYEGRLRTLDGSTNDASSPVDELRAELEKATHEKGELESLLARVKEELETSQQRLQRDQEASRGRIEQLELDLSSTSASRERAISERGQIEERAAVLKKELSVLQRQLNEERESFAKQKQQLEAEVNQSRAGSEEVEPLAKKGRFHKKKGALEDAAAEESSTLTKGTASRIRSLEKELSTDSPISTEKQTATTRISRLESRWEDLKSRLLPKDREIAELRQQSDEYRLRIEQLESALAAAGQKSEDSSEPPKAQPEENSAGLQQLTLEAVQALYNQSMGKLTVVMASAEIVLMNPKLDPKARESILEIRTEGQSMLELIKSYTLPPETNKSE